MWVFTRFGFFSIVRDAQTPGHLLVRGRDRSDVEALADRFGTSSADPRPEVRVTPDADYRYKFSAPSADVAVLLAEVVSEVDYTNFKSTVSREQGPQRAHDYHDVWEALLPIQDRSAALETPKGKR